TVGDGEGAARLVRLSPYFASQSNQVIRKVQGATDQWGNVTYSVTTDDLTTVGGQLEQRLATVMDEGQRQGLGYAPETLHPAQVEPGLHFEVPPEAAVGHIRFDSQQRQFVQYSSGLEWEPVKVVRNRLSESQALLQLRDLGVATIEAQSLGQGQLAADEAREQLASAWREYVDRFGPINRY